MAATVRGNLASLNECVTDSNSPQRSQSAKDLVSDLSKLVLENITPKDLEYVCSLLFNENEGVIVFLRQSANNDEFRDSKLSCLEFLLTLSDNARYHVRKHVKIIKDACLSLFMRDKFAKVKATAVKLLIKMFEIHRGTSEELEINSLIGKVFLALSGTGGSKLQPTVKAEVYHLLGAMSQYFPECMMNYSDKLLGIFLADLKQQMTSNTKSPELPVIAGCFHGLAGYLHNFTHSAEEDPRRAAEIFNYINSAINTKDLKRFEIVRAALNLLSKHIQQVSPFVYDKNKDLYLNLKMWAGHKNPELRKCALAAMESFFHEMAELLLQKADSNDERAKKYFKFYIEEFHGVISSSFTSAELNVAIKGYGAFAAPCKRFLTQNDVQYMFNEMILRSEQIYLLDNSEIREDKIPYLPSFMECLSSIVFELETVDQTFTRPLERLTVLLIEHFPQISPYQQHYSYCAIFKLIVAMYSKGSIFNLFLHQIVFQGILRTCSHPVSYGIENEVENKNLFEDKDPRKITYRDYLNFWQSLLDSTKIRGFKAMSIDVDCKETVSRLIYDEIISSILTILRKLDLTAIKSENANDEDENEDCLSFDPVSGLQPINIKDFHILINVVDFSKVLLQTGHTTRFKKWVYNFGCQVIELCSRYPVVSGLYKMFALCLKICNTINYFEVPTTKSENESMDITLTQSVLTEQEQNTCLVLFSKFVQEVIASLYQYKDDLLASCLQVLLSLPKQLVELHLPLLMPAIQISLRMGLSYLPLANLTLDALEAWCDYVSMDQMKPHLIPILPSLNEYLKSTSHQKFDMRENVVVKSQNPRRGRSAIVLKNYVQKIHQSKETVSLSHLQYRILLLLGSLGSDINRHLVSTDIADFAVAWDMKKHLKFAVPFADMKPIIYLDLFLPRVIELAKTSAERQTKSAACELLHSLVLFMLGSGAQTPESLQKNYPMDKLYKRIFPALISLACDVESIAKQLFEPLMLQLIHWFTSNQKYESAETKVLLDALMDGIAHPTDTSLRDFSARCLKEFVIWSIKQTTPEKLRQSPINMKSLLKRMYSMALHPNAFQRLGAAFVFNSIYTVFREEESLVDIFALEILYYLVTSLAIAHQDEKNFGTQTQAKTALDHIERIIRVKAVLLNTEQKNRRFPKTFDKGTLECAVLWLLQQCARPQTECSHKCMQLVHKLSPLLPGVSSTANYFKNLLTKKGSGYLIEIFVNSAGLNELPNFSRENFNFRRTITWLRLLLASVDVFSWIFGEKLLGPADILPHASDFFDALNFFLTKIAMEKNIGDGENFVLTPKEMNLLNQTRCSIIVRLMDLFMILINHSQDNAKFFQNLPELWTLFALIVIEPTSLGFDVTISDVQKNLPAETQKLLVVLKKSLPPNGMRLFEKALSVQITKCAAAVIMDETFTLDEDRILIQMPQYLKGLVQLFETGFDVVSLSSRSNFVTTLKNHLFNVVFASIVTLQDGRLVSALLNPSVEDFANKLLNFSFSFGVSDSLVISCILNSTTVFANSGSASSTTTRGSLFLSLFSDTLSSHLAQNAESFCPSIIDNAENSQQTASVMNTVLDRVSRNRDSRKRYGGKLLEALLTLWPRLSNQFKGNSQALLSILSNMFTIDSKMICNEQNKSFDILFNDYLKMVVEVKTSPTFTSRVLDLLPFFTNLSENYTARLKNSLFEMANNTFPLRSKELAVGSPKYNEYIGIFNKILCALELSGSFMLLEFIISIVCRESQHAYEDQVQKSLSNFIKRLPLSKQHEAVQIAFDVFTNENSFTNDIRRNTVERVCRTLLRHSGIIGLKEFFRKNITHIMDVIQAKDIKGSEEKLKSQLVSKIGCFQLIELLYTRLNKDELSSKASTVNEGFCKGSVQTGKELTQAITKHALTARRENTQGEITLVELRREYHCCAYNTLIAVVCCTQTEIKFYTGFLFSENVNKGEYLWENIVDTNRQYEFEAELKSAFERKRQFVLIRQAAHEKIKEQFGEDENEDLVPDSVHYLTSQYLSASSLCEEVSQFDFSISTKALKAGSHEEKTLPFPSKETVASTSPSGDYYLELELDPLNQHECMGTMTALVQHLSSLNPASTNNEMPPWMTPLHTKMCNSNTHHNVKLFIAKMIINNAKIFEPVAKFWLAPLIQLIVSGYTGREINFFNADLMVVLLEWATVAIPDDNIVERSLASRMLEFAMTHCGHERRDIFKNNLEIVKTIIELWKPRLDIPFHVIYENLNNPDPTATMNSVGIQLLGIVLVNGLAPYSSSMNVDKDKFLKVLAMNITFKYSQVYVAAAEVIGLTMKYLEEKESTTSGSFHDAVFVHVNQLANNETGHFVNVVHKLQLHYPPFAMRFIQKILSLVQKLHGNFKVMCLEIIRTQVDKIEGVFIYMKNVNINSLITHRQEDMQVVTLEIVERMLTLLKPTEILFLMPSVCNVVTQPNIECRTQAYNILMWIFDNYRNEETGPSLEIKSLAQEGLIQGLADQNEKLRLTINNYWSHETRLPTATVNRSISLLSNLYSPTIEGYFLGYASFLLLEMTSRSPDYNRKIFEHPLSDCRFSEYNVDYSWTSRHSSMMPMFTGSLSSQSGSVGSFGGEKSLKQIRATQDQLNFTPTQDQGDSSGSAFNWLTQRKVDSSATLETFGSASLQSKLLFTVGKSPSKRPSPLKRSYPSARPDLNEDFVQPTPQPSPDDSSLSQSSQMFRIRRRFYKDQYKAKNFFAKRETQKQIRRQEMEVIRKERRKSQVTLYRKYRIGDLPDIEINYSALIVPLQALAGKDDKIAKILFTSLIDGILNEAENDKVENELEEIFVNLASQFESIVKKSTQYNSALISFIMEIAFYKASRIRLDSDDVSLACIASSQQNMGINLLEKYLIDDDINAPNDDQPKQKKSRRESFEENEDLKLWLKLGELYKSLDNYDVVRGIFNKKFAIRDLTGSALEAESRGDFHSAAKFYEEALSDESNDIDNAEVVFWEDSLLQCYNWLTKWKEVDSFIVRSLNEESQSNQEDLSNVWSDTFYQDHYLSYLIRAKLKLIIERHGDGSLLKFVDAALIDTQNSNRRLLLESQYSEELALLYIIQQNFDRATHYVNKALGTFLYNWGSNSQCNNLQQFEQLQRLQALSEMKAFLTLIKQPGASNADGISKVHRAVSKWEHKLPHQLDSVSIWDDIVSNRTLYLEIFAEKMSSLPDDLQEVKFSNKASYINNVTEQNNFPVALKLLDKLHSTVKNADNKNNLIRYYHVYANVHLKRTKAIAVPSDRVRVILNTWTEFTRFNVEHDAVLRTTQMKLQSESAELLAQAVEEKSDVLTEVDKKYLKMLEQHLEKKINRDQIVFDLRNFSLSRLREVVSFSTDSAQAHFDLAMFCDKHLRDIEEKETANSSSDISEVYPTTVVDSLLCAMKLNYTDAINHFPRLLQITEKYPSTLTVFKEKSKQVATWMFVGWVNQMVAILDKPNAETVQNILDNIASVYPQALVYPLKLSSEGYSFDSTATGRRNKKFVKKIQGTLKITHHIDKLIFALDQLSDFDCVFRDHKQKIEQLLRKADQRSEAIEEINRMKKRLFTPDENWGKYRTLFAQNCASLSDQIKPQTVTLKNFTTLCEKISEKIAETSRRHNKKLALNDYSPWLNNFNSLSSEVELEIPGQYHGKQKPILQLHVKIAGFGQNVLNLQSIRCPRQITIRGNNERDYRFLVKQGEDLRLDQRIEQLFNLMNDIYSSDSECGSRRLKLTTYQVIPLTNRLGLVEWVEHTNPFRLFLTSAMTEEEYKHYSDKENGVSATYCKWLTSKAGKNFTTLATRFSAVFRNTTNPETSLMYNDLVNKVPRDLLRRAFFNMSSSLEAFVVLRNHFATSHAVICISHYLLGIGDRHLSNFMIDLHSGVMIGIDFGHAFGTATQFLPIPELVPFRLTPQFLFFMDPLKEKGIYTATMIHVLSALRNNAHRLINLMDVFVKEPSLDWKEYARKQAEQGAAENVSDESWYPLQKIAFARRKLNGDNPAFIMRDELTFGHSRNSAFTRMSEVCLGTTQQVRSRYPASGLTVQQQVTGLIDQATDKNILGRTFMGWEPWM